MRNVRRKGEEEVKRGVLRFLNPTFSSHVELAVKEDQANPTSLGYRPYTWQSYVNRIHLAFYRTFISLQII